MCLMQYIAYGTVQITEQLSRQRHIQNTVELGHVDKGFVKNTRKRGTAGKHLGVSSPISLKTTF